MCNQCGTFNIMTSLSYNVWTPVLGPFSKIAPTLLPSLSTSAVDHGKTTATEITDLIERKWLPSSVVNLGSRKRIKKEECVKITCLN
jgi:hypothetical protein